MDKRIATITVGDRSYEIETDVLMHCLIVASNSLYDKKQELLNKPFSECVSKTSRPHDNINEVALANRLEELRWHERHYQELKYLRDYLSYKDTYETEKREPFITGRKIDPNV